MYTCRSSYCTVQYINYYTYSLQIHTVIQRLLNTALVLVQLYCEHLLVQAQHSHALVTTLISFVTLFGRLIDDLKLHEVDDSSGGTREHKLQTASIGHNGL